MYYFVVGVLTYEKGLVKLLEDGQEECGETPFV